MPRHIEPLPTAWSAVSLGALLGHRRPIRGPVAICPRHWQGLLSASCPAVPPTVRAVNDCTVPRDLVVWGGGGQVRGLLPWRWGEVILDLRSA